MQLIPTNKKTNDCVQTPPEVAEAIVKHFKPAGKILEPCIGEGNFLKALPTGTDWCEIKKGKDFFNNHQQYDWIITNPPFSQMRRFIQHSIEISTNVVFLTSINHLWLKARIRDIKDANYGIKQIATCETPRTFPPSGFQIGCFHLQKKYKGEIMYNEINWESAKNAKTNTTKMTSTKTTSASTAERNISNCPWAERNHCNNKYCMGEECDLYDLDYNETDIKQRIEKEQQYIQNNPDQKETNRDKTMGILLLTKEHAKLTGQPPPNIRSLWQLRRKIKKQIKQTKKNE